MLRFKHSLTILLMGAVFALLSGPVVAAPDPSTITFTILHTNDMHGHLVPEVDPKIAPAPEKVGGAAYLATLVKTWRAKDPSHTLLIDGGDIAQGVAISNLFQGRPIVEFMNALNYDAGAIGNHEFDWGPAALAAMIRTAKRPIVCANLLVKATRKPPVGVKRFIVKQVGGVKVGITGLVATETPTISFKQNVAPFQFVNEVVAMKSVLADMKKAGAQVIVVASHCGDKEDVALAQAVPGINVIVGGHTHTALPEPKFVNGTVIVQAGKYMRYLGRVAVTIDRKTWKVVDYTKKDVLIPVRTSDIVPDPAVAAIVKKYQDQVGPAMEQVVGEATEDLTKDVAETHADSALGNLITDALRWKVGADIAVYNSGGIRAHLNKGLIKMNDVYTLLPFDNFVVTVVLKGEQILRLLGQGLGDRQKTIQVSGLSFRIGADGKPSEVMVGGQPIDPGREYKVATVDFLAEGNDGFTVFKEVKERTFDELARDVFTAYVRKNTPLKAPQSGRITVK